MPHIYRCHLTLLESTFFSSREISNYFQTAPLIGNYALAYAMGLCRSDYFNDGTIHYKTHLTDLNERGIYVTPATIEGTPRFTLFQFNAQPETYWYAMGSNVIAIKPDNTIAVGESNGKVWKIKDHPKAKGKKLGLENRPQHGRIRALSIGNKATFYIVSNEPYQPPSYIRLGKFMSKARLTVKKCAGQQVTAEQITVPFLLNPADLSASSELIMFDLVPIPPAPLIRNGVITGQFYQIDNTYLPSGMSFNVATLPEPKKGKKKKRK